MENKDDEEEHTIMTVTQPLNAPPPQAKPVAAPSNTSSSTKTSVASKKPQPLKPVHQEKRNWLIHSLYVRQEFKECLAAIEQQLEDCKGQCEYAIYVKALIKRHQGLITEALQLFQAATFINPSNVSNIKQVGHSLYLLGKHKQAIEAYAEAKKLNPADDWEVPHHTGMCHLILQNYPLAVEFFRAANAIQRHDITYLQLGKAYTLQDNIPAAIEVYLEALQFSPENSELLTTLGLLYLRSGENFRAFEYLNNSLTHDPKNAKTILAAGSIIQDHNDVDVALVKYRVAAIATPNSAQLWNNIGMCFFSKQRYTACIACLKKALFLDPFEWIISYNLGLAHLCTEQYASAFHYFSASINLNPTFAASYMYLGIVLAKLDDFENACSAYDKSLELDDSQAVFRLNYGITLFNHGDLDAAKKQFTLFQPKWAAIDEAARDPEMAQRVVLFESLLKG